MTAVLTVHVIWVKTGSFTINGRTYSGTAGNTAEIPSFDAPVGQGAGFIMIVAPSGPTASRPNYPGQQDAIGQAGSYAPPFGQEFYDTTVGTLLKHDGAGGNWRRHDTGAVV